MEKDVDQLEDKIIKLRLVKIENNQDIETFQEEHFEMQKIVKTRSEINDHIKKKIDSKMENIQNLSGNKNEKDKDK